MKLTIEKLIYGGYGLARTDEKVVFVKDACKVSSAGTGARSGTLTQPVNVANMPSARSQGSCGACARI